MGKTRKPKIRHTIKPDPIGLSANSVLRGDEEEYDESHMPATGPVEAVREQLMNSHFEEKLNGLQSLAVLAAGKDKVAAICQSDIVRIVGPMLCERDNMALRDAAAGALRNMSVFPDVCDYLVEQDILTPLLTLLSEYTQDTKWCPTFDASMGGQIDIRSDVFLHAINLLWNMCESTSTALDIFNQTNMLEGLIRCLDFNVFGLDIAISIAQCLLVVSENNPKSWVVLNEHVPELLLLLNVTGSHSHLYLRTLAAGILTNAPALAALYATTILTSLSTALEVHHQEILSTLPTPSSNANHQNGPELEIKMDTTDGNDETEAAAALRRRRQELPSDADIAVQDIGHLLDAQRVAAEVITNLCSNDEEEYVDVDDDDNSECESVVDYESDRSDSQTNLKDGDRLPVNVVEAIKTLGLVDKLWQRSQPITDDVAQLLRETNVGLLMKVKNLRISSLLCLQNLCNSLTSEDLGGHNAIYNVWVELGKQVFKGPKDATILEPSTSLMRSALEHLKMHKELFNQMTENDLELILEGVRSCSMSEIRANWLRMLGTLGCLLPELLIKLIIAFIVDTCANEDDVWTISEALDALMDMFSDNDWHEIVLELNLPERMKELEKIFKTKIRQQKRELKERYTAVQTVRTNLSRFVVYIEKESIKYAKTKANSSAMK